VSTREVATIACPKCAERFDIALFRGLRIGRLPDVRRAILARSFEVFSCPACHAVVQAHQAPLVYTDFARFQYVAVEARGPADLAAVLARHREAFDRAFLFGPAVAEELARQLVPRLVFGLGALREKLLLSDAGLDDRVVEAVKGDLLAEAGLTPQAAQLRVEEVLDGGHLLCARLGPEGGGPTPVQGWMTARAERVTRRAARRDAISDDYPWLRTDWVVDLHLTAPAPIS
jgi:hypothetical protein